MCDLPNKVQLDELKKKLFDKLDKFLVEASQIDFNYSPLCCELQLLEEKYPVYRNFLKSIGGGFEEIHIPTCVKRDYIYMYILNINDVNLLQDLFNIIDLHHMRVDPMFS